MKANAGFRDKSFRPSIPDSMETVLMLVQPDSINQIDIDLLGTLTTANNDESMVLTGGLLKQDLESIILSQSKQLSTVSRVPYKGVSNYQAEELAEIHVS